MKKRFLKVLSLALVFAISVAAQSFVPASAAMSKSQLQNEISKLENESKQLEQDIKNLQNQINKQAELKKAIEQKIAVTQQQINLCNNEIAKINSAIEANKKEINKKNAEIEADKLAFKKRLRAIYMSSSDSNVQILLGADDFSQFLELSQLTASVSARDKLMIEKIVAAVKLLEEKQAENNKLLEEQVSIRKTVSEKQKQLQAENAQIQSVINSISSDKKDLDSQNASIEKQIKDYRNTLNSMTSTGDTHYVYDGGEFLWPVPGHYYISAGFQSNDSVHNGKHNGIDIAGGGISGKPIIAISGGVVTKSNNSCSHNYGKRGSCGCGGGYGNYVTINHGTGSDGNTYVVTYGHMSSIAVSTGATVKKGQVIGYVGSTGWSTGYHLHFGIAVNKIWRDPMDFYTKVK